MSMTRSLSVKKDAWSEARYKFQERCPRVPLAGPSLLNLGDSVVSVGPGSVDESIELDQAV